MTTTVSTDNRTAAGDTGLRHACRSAIVAAIMIGIAAPAYAQLDPLLFIKGPKPNVLLVVDTSHRMQADADNSYYDQNVYSAVDGNEDALGVTVNGQKYRRKYVGLQLLNSGSEKFTTSVIVGVGQTDHPADYTTFDSATRLAVARNALIRAIELNDNAVRFGLIQTRQNSPALGSPLNEGPVKSDDPGQWFRQWKITWPTVTSSNATAPSTSAVWCQPDVTTCGSGYAKAAPNNYIRALLAIPADSEHATTPSGLTPAGLLPAGQDAPGAIDSPVKYMLDDAKTEATRLITTPADTLNRNTVVVLIVGGGEGGSSAQDPAAAATAFKNISSRRVPIYVIAIAPPAADVASLQAIASNSGGQYIEITKAMIQHTAPGAPVPEIVRGINTAVQHTFATFADFNAAPTGTLPYGPATEYQVTSPIIGTVNLANGHDILGADLPNSVIMKGINVIPQRSNVMVTTGFAVPGTIATPGFPGRLRAFRVYRPVSDITQTSGYKFVGDGTALWVARTPYSSEGPRNIYTALPNGTIVPFTSDNAATLAPYLNDKNASGSITTVRAAALIDYVRALPLGAFVDSTPAFLDAPSLDPPPDADYPGFKDACEGRRTLIFVGGNDGMMHAIDARTGVEVWAFIPFNLLPKLRALREGQPADQFRYFVDGSAKLADVKVDGAWRTYVMFGEGPGGTFYQTLDATMSNMAASVAQDSDDVGAVLGYFAGTSPITFRWSFPSYAHFDYDLGSAITPYGDIDKDLGTAVEKSVGQTWSDPAVGQVLNSSGSWVTLVGSGFLPYSQQHQANRGDVRAGTTFYVLSMKTGAVLDSRDVGDDGIAETIDNCAVSGNCTNQKNAVQADPVATGPANSRFIDTAYITDLDGRLWRFGLGLNATGNATITLGPVRLFKGLPAQPLFSSMAVVNVGGKRQYIFFGSGSDLLPSTGVSQSYYLYGVLDDGTGKTDVAASFALALEKVDGLAGDEKVSAYPAVAGDIVFFTTTTFKPGTSSTTLPDANLYAVTFIGGPAYDSTGDDTVTSADKPKVKTFGSGGRATAPFVSDQHLAVAVGGKIEMFGDPKDFNNGVGQMGVRILSWREIR